MNNFTINIINIYPEEKVKLLYPMYNHYKFIDNIPRKYELNDVVLYNGELCKVVSYDTYVHSKYGKVEYVVQSFNKNY